jgi:hypothetical protein
VNAEPNAASARPSERRRHHEIDANLVLQPFARLDARDESGLLERGADERPIREPFRLEHEIGVGRERRHRDVGLSRVEIDRLRAHEHERGALLAERFERVQQDLAGLRVELVRCAKHRHASSSRQSAPRLPKGLSLGW